MRKEWAGKGRSIARATRGLGRPSLDARSLAQPCYLPEELHRPWRREKIGEDRMESVRSMREVGDSPTPLTFKYQPLVGEGKNWALT